MIKLYTLLLIPFLCGCSAMGTYLEDRALDFIDPKYGWAFPACAKVEVTDYLGAGLGLAKAWDTHEWFGRHLNAKGEFDELKPDFYYAL